MALTERKIRDAKSGEKSTILWDDIVKGFGLRVTPAGVKSYVLSYRVDGRKRLATIARVSEISLKAAREKAGAELAKIRDGDDPLQRRADALAAPTVADGLDRFFEELCPERIRTGKMAARTVEEYSWQAKKYVRPAIGNLKVAAVTRQDVERSIKGVKPTTRNRVLAFMSRLFRQFERWDWRPAYSNPTRDIERAREQARDRTLEPSELTELAKALEALDNRYPAPVAAIRTAALTGLRIGEVLAIRWADISFETGQLTLPETKTGRRVHHLPTAALEVISGCRRINDYVFTIGRDAPCTYRYVRTVFGEAVKAAGLEDVRLHDLRRTLMTHAAASGVGTHILRDLLGHKSTVMADRYIRSVGNPVKEARERVGAAMAGMLQGRNADVVEIHKKIK